MMNRIFSCSSQGIQKKKSVVLCTLDNGNCSVITGCAECIYRFTSLPRKNIQKHNNLEYTFHCSDIFDCDLLPSSRKMGLHKKPRSDLGQLTTDSYLSRKKLVQRTRIQARRPSLAEKD